MELLILPLAISLVVVLAVVSSLREPVRKDGEPRFTRPRHPGGRHHHLRPPGPADRLLAALVFSGPGLSAFVRNGLLLSGALCLAGLLGVVLENVDVRSMGVALLRGRGPGSVDERRALGEPARSSLS